MQNMTTQEIDQQIATLQTQRQQAAVYEQQQFVQPVTYAPPAPRQRRSGSGWAAASTLAVVAVAAAMLWQMFGSDVRVQTVNEPETAVQQPVAPPVVVEVVQPAGQPAETTEEPLELVVEEAGSEAAADVEFDAADPVLIERVQPTAPAPTGVGVNEATAAITAGMAAARDQQQEPTGEQWAHFYQSSGERAVNDIAGVENPASCDVQPPAVLPPSCD